MYQLFIDSGEVPEGASRETAIVDESTDYLAKMNMPTRPDGYPYELTPNGFNFAERYFRRSLSDARKRLKSAKAHKAAA